MYLQIFTTKQLHVVQGRKKGCKTSGQKSCFHTVLHHFILSHFIFSGGKKSLCHPAEADRWSRGGAEKIKMCFSELSCREAAVVSDRRLIRQCALTAPLPIFCAPKGTENPQGRLFSCRRMELNNTKASGLWKRIVCCLLSIDCAV